MNPDRGKQQVGHAGPVISVVPHPENSQSQFPLGLDCLVPFQCAFTVNTLAGIHRKVFQVAAACTWGGAAEASICVLTRSLTSLSADTRLFNGVAFGWVGPELDRVGDWSIVTWKDDVGATETVFGAVLSALEYAVSLLDSQFRARR